MAHRLASKINRLINQKNFRIIVNSRFRSTKVNLQNEYASAQKGVISKNNASFSACSHDGGPGAGEKKVEKKFRPGELRPLPPKSSTTEYCIPQVMSATVPEVDPPRRRFQRSNTQNAVTQPLKLPRLANPFPEPVKHLMSQTVSDKEKQDLMFAEMQMEQRFLEQQRRETLYRQRAQQYVQPANQPQEQAQKPKAAAPPPAQMQVYEDKQSVQHFTPGTKKVSCMDMFNISKRFYSGYSMRNVFPEVPATASEADRILQSLKNYYPEHELPRKPLFQPGSPEEKRFVEKTLQFLARHKRAVHKSNAPFPSYSEVKTFVRRPSFKPMPMPANAGGRRTFCTYAHVQRRNCSGMCCNRRPKKLCANFKGKKPCKPPHPEGCIRILRTQKCKKLEAPYPAYTDCVEPPYEDLPSECKMCPWDYPGVDFKQFQGRKKYSTFAGATTVRQLHVSTLAQRKKRRISGAPVPCKNPHEHKPPCDYVKAAEERDELRAKYRGHAKSPYANKKFHTLSFSKLLTTWLNKKAGAPAPASAPAPAPVLTTQGVAFMSGTGATGPGNAISEPGSPVAVECKKAGKGRKRKKCPKFKDGCRKIKSNKMKPQICREPKKRPLPECSKTCFKNDFD